MKCPSEVIADFLRPKSEWAANSDAALIVSSLRDSGYIIVRDDAIRLAQAHARAEALEDVAANDNRQLSRVLK